jgi:NAD-dependent dihydropyrimidine dehydrogenase PreA subunit
MDWQYWKVVLGKKMMPRKFYQFNPSKIPWVARKIEKALMEGDDMLVMPRNEVIHINKPFDAPAEEVLPTQVLEHFIRKSSYICMIDKCLCRDALKCKDYPIDGGCLYLGEAAKGVHPKFGRQVTVDEALAHIEKSQKLGLVSMVGRSKLDCVTHSIGPGNKLMAICNCCPCCCVARGIAYAPPLLGEKFSIIPGMKIKVTDRCEGCGVCSEEGRCVFFAIHQNNGRAEIDYSKCRGCSRCISACPHNAIEVVIEDPDYIQHTIERLERAVDVT